MVSVRITLLHAGRLNGFQTCVKHVLVQHKFISAFSDIIQEHTVRYPDVTLHFHTDKETIFTTHTLQNVQIRH